jgi:hypothetical protein
MKSSVSKSLRQLALCCTYALGVFFVVASGGGSSGGGSTPDASCRLEVSAIAPAADSTDIWIGVYSIRSGEEVNSVARLDSTGAEDVRIPVGSGRGNIIRTLAMATDGSRDVYVGGDFPEGIFRLNSIGSADPGFDVGTGFNFSVTKITPLDDGTTGQIYVAGYFTEYKGLPVSGLVRLNQDGSLDTGFVSITKDVEDVVLAGGSLFPPGYVYSGGYGSVGDSASRLVRWRDNGDPDDNSTFPNTPFPFTTNIGPVLSVVPALDGTDSVYAGGDIGGDVDGGFDNGIIRLSLLGTTDPSFDVGSGFNDDVRQILRADDATGDIYVVGAFTTYEGINAKGIARLNADGSPEASFVTDKGFTIPDGTAPFAEIASLALALDLAGDPAGTIYVGGDFLLYNDTAMNGIARLDNDGSLDLGFAVDIMDGSCTNETIPGLD